MGETETVYVDDDETDKAAKGSMLLELAEELEELKRLRVSDFNARMKISSMRKQLFNSQDEAKELAGRVAALEGEFEALSPLDEDWLFRMQAKVRFVRKRKGGHRVVIESRGRVLVALNGPEESKGSLLRGAVKVGREKRSG